MHGVKLFKLGHAGTLDPFADGVLVLLGGKATTLQDAAIHHPKSYRATVVLGATSPSLDPATPVQIVDPAFTSTREDLDHVLQAMIGEVMQLPPSYSAKRVAGRRAYHIAVRGKQPALLPAKVRIDRIEVVSFDSRTAVLDVDCGSGCYIRAIARDIALALGTVGYLSALTRTQSAGFLHPDCWDFPTVLKELVVDPAVLAAFAAKSAPKVDTPQSESTRLD
jgi:tRNA pseudouridine55 synthase